MNRELSDMANLRSRGDQIVDLEGDALQRAGFESIRPETPRPSDFREPIGARAIVGYQQQL